MLHNYVYVYWYLANNLSLSLSTVSTGCPWRSNAPTNFITYQILIDLKFFYTQQYIYNIANIAIIKDPTTPQTWRYITATLSGAGRAVYPPNNQDTIPQLPPFPLLSPFPLSPPFPFPLP